MLAQTVAERIQIAGELRSPRPFWSVMIPTYNAPADYLKATLHSILQQDPGAEQMQIEVVDDCSPEGAPVDLVKRLAGDRVTVHRESRNLGLARIWNKCIERAEGCWIHILHQDDLVYPGFYESLRAGAEKFPEVGAAFCRHAHGDETGEWLKTSPPEQALPGILENLIETLVIENNIICASMAVKKSTYEAVGGFNPELTHALDWEMWLRISNAFPVFYEPAVLACWRNHSNAMTSRQIRSGENIRDIAKAIRIWKKYLPAESAERFSLLAREHYSSVALDFAQHFLDCDDLQSSMNQLKAAVICHPSIPVIGRAAKLAAKAGVSRSRRASRVISDALGVTSHS